MFLSQSQIVASAFHFLFSPLAEGKKHPCVAILQCELASGKTASSELP